MPGFFSAKFENENMIDLVNYDETNCLQGEISSNGICIKRNILNTFKNDKLFFENENIAVVTDGVILNSDLLKEKYNKKSLSEVVEEIAINNKKFFCELDGHFSGLVYYKKDNKIVAFTGPLGDHAIFYYYNDKKNLFAIGSQLNYIVDYLKFMNIPTTEDVHGISCFLDYG